MYRQIPKKRRIFNRDTVEYVRNLRDGCCMIGLGRPGKYGACLGILDVHHMVNVGTGGDDVKENMITLCRKHHGMAQEHRIERDELKSILTQYFGYQYGTAEGADRPQD